ncbi:LPS export ABC transporter periplasmic protein LptC [Lysobacter solisilvae (ex Woo and Kim 2020)]|uniref:LPS export ABC transporter periplasmic protein LptC n=1 Tax=Agrilutibacter terrestris TaxID=2865112 RepID=A0A7H0FYR1_9GAMM|nr:LPS export ABC transporter periplasmic protein LptC [Lysobacter terrestris]QNP41177.1 LPS export ABC transporter periplasmic protein LptC [Lysobacter terrestris]
MSWRSIITLVLLAGALISGWSVWNQRKKDVVPTGAIARSDYVLIDFELTALNPQGKESFTLRAPRLARDPQQRTMDIATPLFLIPPGAGAGSDAWEVRATNGWVSPEGDELKLRGNVRGVSSGLTGPATTLTSRELNVYPDARRASSPGRVEVTRPGSILSGRGLQLDLATKRYSFDSEVHHRYVPTAR